MWAILRRLRYKAFPRRARGSRYLRPHRLRAYSSALYQCDGPPDTKRTAQAPRKCNRAFPHPAPPARLAEALALRQRCGYVVDCTASVPLDEAYQVHLYQTLTLCGCDGSAFAHYALQAG